MGLEARVPCPVCRGPIHPVAGRCKHCRADLHALRFIRRARDLGFPIAEIQGLLGLWRNQRRASAEVRRLALKHVAELDRKIEELRSMRVTLANLAAHCHGDARPHCPILDDLARLPASE